MTEEKRGVRFRAPQPAEEFQQMLSKLMNSTESIKEIERIIKTPDSETKYTYEIQVDSATGKQKVIEKFTTTKKECRLCGGYTAQVYECEDCHVQVCANDSRYHDIPQYSTGLRLCKNCFRQHFPDEYKLTEQ